MIDTLIRFYNPRHTAFQCDAFITSGEGVTLWGMFRQALRQLFGSISTCRQMMADNALLDIDLQEASADLSDPRAGIKLWDLQWRVPIARRKLEVRLQELCRFYAQAVGCYEELTKTSELTEERQRELELDFWSEKYVLEAALRAAVGQGYSVDLFRHVLLLPEPWRTATRRTLINQSGLLQKAKTYTPLDVPLVKVPSLEFAKELCGHADLVRCIGGTAESANDPASSSLALRNT